MGSLASSDSCHFSMTFIFPILDTGNLVLTTAPYVSAALNSAPTELCRKTPERAKCYIVPRSDGECLSTID